MSLLQGLDDVRVWQDAGDVLLKVFVAAFLAGAVGWQREIHGRPAGMRTHMLLVIGVVLLADASRRFGGDPGRIAAQIVTGVGFIGAGTILRTGMEIKGLTSAASLWAVTGIGMAISIGGAMTIVAVVSTVLALVVLAWLNHLERALFPDAFRKTLNVAFESDRSVPLAVVALQDQGAKVRSIDVASSETGCDAKFDVDAPEADAMRAVSGVAGFLSARWSDSN